MSIGTRPVLGPERAYEDASGREATGSSVILVGDVFYPASTISASASFSVLVNPGSSPSSTTFINHYIICICHINHIDHLNYNNNNLYNKNLVINSTTPNNNHDDYKDYDNHYHHNNIISQATTTTSSS
ncbi:hypothetical protein HJFPF1_04298 [Paramyrothecium foliicola]|nr:hypothetical protein HJFPF1_04298 [Paramyrothecium foliicola]